MISNSPIFPSIRDPKIHKMRAKSDDLYAYNRSKSHIPVNKLPIVMKNDPLA